MINEELSKQINLAMGSYSQNSFAELCGINSSSLTRIAKGDYVPSLKTLQKIARKAQNGVTLETLCAAAGFEIELGSLNKFAEDVEYFPIIGSVRAGFDGLAFEDPTGEQIEIPKSLIHGDPKDYFVLLVKGNSMYPQFIDGDRILIKRMPSVDSGDIAVILFNGDEGTIKQVHYVKNEDWLELIPRNPEYPTKRIEGEDLQYCRVLGKVVYLFRKI